MNDIKNQPTEYQLTRKFATITVLSICPLIFIMAYLGGYDSLGQVRAISMCLFIFVCIARIRWNLRRHWWYWATLIVLTILHVPLFVFIRWPSGGPGIVLAPIWILDLFVLYGGIKLAEKIWGGKKSNPAIPEHR